MSREPEDSPRPANRLLQEKSPYLLQHAHNPVDWFPWGEEAFARARSQDKPIFLSIGYSTCHWCHVMERESFEDPEVAELLNRIFVAVKVDREERPDIDGVYMTVCQMLTGSGGWPLTIIMTPDKEPFFAATYLPPESGFGRLGLSDLARRIETVWTTRREEAYESGAKIIQALRGDQDGDGPEETGPADLDRVTLGLAFRQVASRYDRVYGGFGQAPKFPTPHNLTFLLRHWRRTRDGRVLAMVEKTLKAMRQGGIYDQIGLGFHRYSTDREWLLPHFEKMLYDQALLTLAYLETFQASGDPFFSGVAREVIDYVKRDLADPEGGFHSAEDADSEGEEGKFYLWTIRELEEILGPEEGRLAARVWNAEAQGNFREEAGGRRTGANILHLKKELSELAPDLGLKEEELGFKLTSIRERLLAFRSGRVRPSLDDKVLTDWNGLMIAALARAGRVLADDDLLASAVRAAEFILAALRDEEGRLLHRFRDGQAAVRAFADDYAFLTWGLIELHQATFEPRWLKTALDLTEEFMDRFWDREEGAFFFTPGDVDELPVRLKEVYDGALPSANSVAFLNLLRLAGLTGRKDLEDKAGRLRRSLAPRTGRAPMAHTQLMVGLDFELAPGLAVVVAGTRGEAKTESLLAGLSSRFLPQAVVLFLGRSPEGEETRSLAPYTRELAVPNQEPAVFVRRTGEGPKPVSGEEELWKLLESVVPDPER